MTSENHTAAQLADTLLQISGQDARALRSEAILHAKRRFLSASPPRAVRVGLELERYCCDPSGKPADAAGMRALGGYEREAGPWQFEDARAPIEVERLESLEEDLLLAEREMRAHATAHGLQVVSMGAVPNLNPEQILLPSGVARYEAIDALKVMLHDPEIPVPLKNAFSNEVTPQIQATHLNLQVDPSDAIFLLNSLFEIETYRVAVGAAAPLAQGKPTGYKDARIAAWAQGSDLRTRKDRKEGMDPRIGIPNSYFASIDHYLDWCAQGSAFHFSKGTGAVGCTWTVGKLKFLEGALVLEARAPSAQPTAREETAMAAMLLGSLEYRRYRREPPLLRIGAVKQNYEEAQRSGLEGHFLTRSGRIGASEAVRREVESRVRPGLALLGYGREEIDHYLEPLMERIRTRRTPADEMLAYARTQPLDEVALRYAA